MAGVTFRRRFEKACGRHTQRVSKGTEIVDVDAAFSSKYAAQRQEIHTAPGVANTFDQSGAADASVIQQAHDIASHDVPDGADALRAAWRGGHGCSLLRRSAAAA